MGKYDKLLETILQGRSDTNIRFDDLCQLLIRMGFDERIREATTFFVEKA